MIKIRKRILFLESSPIWIFGLPNGFRDCGYEVRISGVLTKEKLSVLLSNFKPELIITVGWGPENSSIEKQKMIHEQVRKQGVPHIYWATEDPTHTESFTLPFLKIVQPDFVFTICYSIVNYYKTLGIKAAHLDFGYHTRVNYPTEFVDTYCNKISVVANAYPNVLKKYPKHFRHHSLYTLITPLLKANQRVDFYGRDWDKMNPFIKKNIPCEWIHGYLPYKMANKVYRSSDIIIGLQNHTTQMTQRTYEILASGGFLLTHDTPEVRRHFIPGRDLVVSSSPEETFEQVKYYLKYPEKRQKIQKQGLLSVEKHSYRHRAKYIMDVLKQENILKKETFM